MQKSLCKAHTTPLLNKPQIFKEADSYVHIQDVPAEVWSILGESAVGPAFSEYWRALEETTSLTTGSFRFVVLYNQEGLPKAVCTFQYVSFDMEQVLDKVSRYRWLASSITSALIKSDHRLLVGGNVWLSGEHGVWALSASERENAQTEAADILMAEDKNIFTVLLKDFKSAEAKAGYHAFSVDPIMELNLEDFTSWDDYVGKMRSKYRQRLKSAYKKSDSVISWELDKNEIVERSSELMALFYQVVKDDLFSLSLPPANYLAALKEALGNEFTVTGYFLENRLIGFRASLHTEAKMYAYLVGFSQEHNLPYKLYQRMLYDYVQEAIQSQHDLIDFGRTALEIKSCLGAEPRQHSLFVKFRYTWLHRLLKPVFDRLGPAQWEQRNVFSD